MGGVGSWARSGDVLGLWRYGWDRASVGWSLMVCWAGPGSHTRHSTYHSPASELCARGRWGFEGRVLYLRQRSKHRSSHGDRRLLIPRGSLPVPCFPGRQPFLLQDSGRGHKTARWA